MNGYNNGKIGLSQRQLTDALKCSPRKVVRCMAELMEHGLIDVHAEGKWKERLAREYRLTFVTTKGGPATNDYLRWKPTAKSGAAASVSTSPHSGSVVKADFACSASAVVTVGATQSRKTANPENPPASDAASLISKPYVGSASWWTADHVLQAHQVILGRFAREPLKAAA